MAYPSRHGGLDDASARRMADHTAGFGLGRPRHPGAVNDDDVDDGHDDDHDLGSLDSSDAYHAEADAHEHDADVDDDPPGGGGGTFHDRPYRRGGGRRSRGLEGAHGVRPDSAASRASRSSHGLRRGGGGGGALATGPALATASMATAAPPWSASSTTAAAVVQHPSFDVATYVGGSTGMPRVQRLLFIGQHCPPLRVDAYRDALQTVVHATRHVALYLDTHARLNAALAAAGMLEVPADAAWVAATADAVRHTSERLETALRQSRSNLLKEQIRLAQLALGDHAWQCGELQTAAKCYARSRDYGSTNQHVLERGLREMALALETRNLHLMNTTLATLQALLPASGTMTTAVTAQPAAPAAPGSGSAAASTAPSPTTATAAPATTTAAAAAAGFAASPAVAVAAAAPPPSMATVAVIAPLDGMLLDPGKPTALDVGVYVRACRAVMDLHDQRYADVARGLLKLPFPGVHHAAAVLLPHEILWQTVLCGLATLSRAELKALLIEFAPYLDLDGRARDAVQALLDGAYDVLFAALASAEPDCLLDMRLHRAVPTLVAAVRQRALVQYTRPFVSLRLDAMAAKLGLPVDDLERDVCALIAQGLIPMVVDSYAGVLYAKPADQRSRVLQKTLDQADDYVQTVHTMLLRMSLGQSGLAVQSSRDHDVW